MEKNIGEASNLRPSDFVSFVETFVNDETIENFTIVVYSNIF